MMKALFSLLIFVMYQTAVAQCQHTWLRYLEGNTDTIVRVNGCLDRNPISNAETVDAFISMAKEHTLSGMDIESILMKELDSLKQLPRDSSVLAAISNVNYQLTSQFQIISSDSIEYALYAMDTLVVKGRSIVIYAFSSNFESKWNEDFDNWFFYYTREFGIINATYVCIWDGPCFKEITLVDSCRINNGNRAIFEKVKRYILNTKFRE